MMKTKPLRYGASMHHGYTDEALEWLGNLDTEDTAPDGVVIDTEDRTAALAA